MLGGYEIIIIAVVTLVLYFVRGGNKNISNQDEIDLGDELIYELEKKDDLKLIDDDFLTKIVNELTKNTNVAFPNISIYVEEGEDLINAMAVPGGKIILTKGFYRIMETQEIDEHEIAGVIAHEIGHIELKHAVKSIKSEQKVGSLIKAIKILKTGNLKAGMLTKVGSMLYKSNFMQAKEFEADKFAVEMLYKSKYSVQGLSTFLTKMQEEYGFNDNELAVYFDSHPPVEKRVNSMNEVIEKLMNENKRLEE